MMAAAELSPKTICPAFARVKTPPKMSQILAQACIFFECTEIDILSDVRSAHLVEIRAIITFVMRGMTLQSLPQMGRILNRDHTTVLHALRKAEALYGLDSEFTRKTDLLAARVEAMAKTSTTDVDAFALATKIVTNPRVAITVSVEGVQALAAAVCGAAVIEAECHRLEAENERLKAELHAERMNPAALDVPLNNALRVWAKIHANLNKSPSQRGEAALRLRLNQAEREILSQLNRRQT